MTAKKSISELDKIIGNNLKNIRERNSITRTQLAEAMNITAKPLWSYENGLNSISINSLINMRASFEKENIPFETLLFQILVKPVENYEGEINKR